jgi:peroxiredoxin family protein
MGLGIGRLRKNGLPDSPCRTNTCDLFHTNSVGTATMKKRVKEKDEMKIEELETTHSPGEGKLNKKY